MLQAAIHRLQQLHEAISNARSLPSSVWQHMDEDLKAISAEVQHQVSQQVEINVQRFQKNMFDRLAQLSRGSMSSNQAISSSR